MVTACNVYVNYNKYKQIALFITTSNFASNLYCICSILVWLI